MTPAIQTGFWSVVGRSVCGAAHRRRGAPNQDALAWSPAGDDSVVAAVADGHGSSASFRSATGAALAVETASAVLREFAADDLASGPAAICGELAARWRQAVDRHFASDPCDESGGRYRAYGATILAVLATPSYLLYLQLGDGDILIVSGDGTVARPWPRDPRLLGVETTSLCGDDAATDTRLALQTFSEGAGPALVMLATDGYANSFREDDGFLRTGVDLLDLFREQGIGGIEPDLETWLNEASELGSGDDITLAVLCRSNLGAGDGR